MGLSRKQAKEELLYEANGHYVICEVIRIIYDLIHNLPDKELKEEITEKLIDAFIMAKKMSERLHYYKNTYMDKTGNGGRKIPRLHGTIERRLMRKARKHE